MGGDYLISWFQCLFQVKIIPHLSLPTKLPHTIQHFFVNYPPWEHYAYFEQFWTPEMVSTDVFLKVHYAVFWQLLKTGNLIPSSFLSHLLPSFPQFYTILDPSQFLPVFLPLALSPWLFQLSARFNQTITKSTGWMVDFESIVWCRIIFGKGS